MKTADKMIGPDHPDFDDNPPLSAGDIAKMRPVADIMPELTSKGRGPGRKRPKIPVNVRLDTDVIDALKRDGDGWQTRANTLLRQVLDLPNEPPLR